MPEPSGMQPGQPSNTNLLADASISKSISKSIRFSDTNQQEVVATRQADQAANRRRMVITVETSNNLVEAIQNTNIYDQQQKQFWTLSPKAADRIENNKVSSYIQDGAVDMLAVELPTPGVDIKAEKATHFYRTLNRWIASAKPFLQKGMIILIFGTFCKHWQEPMLDDMVQAGILHKSYHRLCHFDLKLGQQEAPSSACFVTASNIQLEGHGCKCNNTAASAHVLDWHLKDANHQRHEIRSFMLGKVLEQLKTTTDSSTTPDSLQHN